MLLSFGLKVTDKVIDRPAVQKVAWVHSHGSLFHESVLPILSVHGKRLPHHEGGTHYAYDQTGYLTHSTEIKNDHEDEDGKQASRKEEEVLRLQALELHRPTYTFVDFPTRHCYKKKERRMVAATMRKMHAPNQEAAVLLVSGSPELNLL